MNECIICNQTATTGVRGTIEKDYVYTCSFHAGMLQMIFEKLNVSDSIKWRPLYEKLDTLKAKQSGV